MLRRSKPEPESEPEEPAAESSLGKGRATPKRRDSAPKRQPISAPRTTKEANQLRKQQAAQGRSSSSASNRKLSTKEFREAMRRGDESVLPRRDKGPVRKLTRDWVDTHFMFSNYLLLAFPLIIISGSLPRSTGTFLTIGVFVLFAVEWLFVGRRVRALAESRFGDVKEKAWVLGLYAGQRAMMPRRWRQPGAILRRGDKI